MPAEFDSGFLYRTPAWHKQGNVQQAYPADWNEAREWAGVTWEPTLVPVYRKAASPGPDGLPVFVEVPDTKLISRSDDADAVLARGVSDDYALIDHVAMGEIAGALLEQANRNAPNKLQCEALVSLRGGKSVAAVFRLDEPFTVPGDESPMFPLLALHNHHDGLGGCRAICTTIRTVCANTFSANEAMAERHGRFFTFRHRGDYGDRLADAVEALSGLKAQTDEFKVVANDLANLGIVERHVDMFLSEFIPMPPRGMITDRVAANVENARQAFRNIMASPTTAPVADTAWGLVQGATEYLDHVRPARSTSTLMGRSILRPEPLKAKAITLVREVLASA